MVLPGETVETGAKPVCSGCKRTLRPGVHKSAAGYYVGYWCYECGPFSRESEYYKTREEAERVLASGGYGRDNGPTLPR